MTIVYTSQPTDVNVTNDNVNVNVKNDKIYVYNEADQALFIRTDATPVPIVGDISNPVPVSLSTLSTQDVKIINTSSDTIPVNVENQISLPQSYPITTSSTIPVNVENQITLPQTYPITTSSIIPVRIIDEYNTIDLSDFSEIVYHYPIKYPTSGSNTRHLLKHVLSDQTKHYTKVYIKIDNFISTDKDFSLWCDVNRTTVNYGSSWSSFNEKMVLDGYDCSSISSSATYRNCFAMLNYNINKSIMVELNTTYREFSGYEFEFLNAKTMGYLSDTNDLICFFDLHFYYKTN